MYGQFSVLLYSQYSSKSKKLLNFISQYRIETSYFNLTLLCIDNENIRKQILSSKKININVVPCILVIYPDGVVEKYEGTNAFNWMEDKITKLIPKLYDEPPPLPPQQLSSPQSLPQSPEQIEENATIIDDIESDEEDMKIMKPKSGIRTDSGNYEIGIDFGEMEEPKREVKRGVKTTTQIVKGGKSDILSAAQAMQKLREDDMEKNKPIGIPINN